MASIAAEGTERCQYQSRLDGPMTISILVQAASTRCCKTLNLFLCVGLDVTAITDPVPVAMSAIRASSASEGMVGWIVYPSESLHR